MENRCVVCGDIIPEGRQVCPECLNDLDCRECIHLGKENRCEIIGAQLSAYDISHGSCASFERVETVEHPTHYNRVGGMECIEEMLLIFGKTAVMNFCLLNAWKYRYRAADKNGMDDLRKSDFYMHMYKDLATAGIDEDEEDE